VPVRLPPDIAIEGISPSESASKVERKRMTYLKNGVKESG
jgi:Uma2 family endonuclease